jgi:RNA polymerase sigma-70 factor (sigma-E family)
MRHVRAGRHVNAAGEARFAAWASSVAPSLHRFAYLLCGDWHEAEDLVQEALARTAVHWSRVERLEHPNAYVRTAVVNQCRSYWRRSGRRNVPESRVVETAVGDATAALADRDEMVAALRTLPIRQRAAVVLRYYEDLSEAETAAVLGCSAGTVKSQTHKALQSLRRSMATEDLQC